MFELTRTVPDDELAAGGRSACWNGWNGSFCQCISGVRETIHVDVAHELRRGQDPEEALCGAEACGEELHQIWRLS